VITIIPHLTIGGGRRRLLPRLILAGAATVALPALYHAAQPPAAGTSVASGSVRLTDMALSPQPSPDLTGGFAAYSDDDQAQLQQQLNQQQLQQSMQQAQEQNDEAEQQFNQDMQQQQTYENQFNNP
jgi:hypothetical protein